MGKEIIFDKDFLFFENRISGGGYFFNLPVDVVKASGCRLIEKAFDKIEAYCRSGCWACGYISYEAGYCFEERLWKCGRGKKRGELVFGIFEKAVSLDNDECDTIMSRYVKNGEFYLARRISYEKYRKNFNKIKEYIEEGDTYQVNYSFPLYLISESGLLELYAYFRGKQKTDYTVCLKLGGSEIISLSPELFFEVKDKKITVKPMKGTSSLGNEVALHNEKNKSENLMIVDLLRNDLGRIGSGVNASRLFDIEKYETVAQMTSVISAKLKSGAGVKDIFFNIFPSGSVTGAPKIRTMEIIDEIEEGARGVYCGAIGFIAPTLKKAVFNVPIRTFEKIGKDRWRYRVGGGIVADSDSESEWREAFLKAGFISLRPDIEFSLVETMLVRKGSIKYLSLHIKRLFASAAKFGFVCDRKEIRKALSVLRKKCGISKTYIARLISDKSGEVNVNVKELFFEKEAAVIFMEREPVKDSDRIFLCNKTTYRPWYDKNNQKEGIFDIIYFDDYGRLLEGGRTNIFCKVSGADIFYTPPLNVEILPGVLREYMLLKGYAAEKVIYAEEVLSGKYELYIGNSVRGLLKCVILS